MVEAIANSAMGSARDAAIIHCKSLSELRCAPCTVAPVPDGSLTENPAEKEAAYAGTCGCNFRYLRARRRWEKILLKLRAAVECRGRSGRGAAQTSPRSGVR